MTEQLNITIDDECPDEIKANGIAWVEDACNWLLSQPRTPDATQPRFSEIKITIKPCGFSRGLRDVRDGRGSVAIDTGTDLKFNILPSIIVIPTTQEIAFRGNLVYLLSQLFRPDGYSQDSFRWQEHLHYQLKFLDRLAESSKAARSVVDDFEQIQADKAEQEKAEQYKQQLEEKRYLQARKRAYDTALRVPSWYVDIHKDSPQLQRDYLITSGGAVIGKHLSGSSESIEQSAQAAPTNKAVEKLSEQEPHSEPFVIPGVDEQVASWAALYYSALGGQTESKEQCS